ncbi:MAG: hypothetical protein KKE79_04580 [Actinobacteria bacterium]|nr:hypothetical protein [Actinomycetota bacterium]MBU4240205.1 hypothetical protein [Actinomycetota bacterium]MBU4302159.1 hypothetical protein [Actinomycetota bacterium]MBU4489893.1 hypothetical protein [Actinomycetota bacterium]MCG2796396.1 hypothetical protein [Actinomycetes bacterium]
MLIRRVLFVSIMMLIAIALTLSGCGGGRDTTDLSAEKAREVLDDSNRKMGELESLEAYGSYDLEAQGPQGEDLDFEFQVEMDVSPGNPEVHMTIDSAGETTDVYMKDGYTYLRVPDEGWVKTEAGASDADGFSPPTPTRILEFSENARNLRMISEDRDHYRLAFDVGEEFLEQQIKAGFGVGGSVAGSEEVLQEIIDKTEMTAVFRISKATRYIENADFTMKIGNMPMVGDVSLTIRMEFSRFNEPVNISLPPEALDATEIKPTPKPPPALPGIPGIDQ